MPSGRVRDTRPQSQAPAPLVVFVIMIVLVADRVLMVPHLPRMTRETPCSTSTPAMVALLQRPRRPKPFSRAAGG
jgi:hypothetical protein